MRRRGGAWLVAMLTVCGTLGAAGIAVAQGDEGPASPAAEGQRPSGRGVRAGRQNLPANGAGMTVQQVEQYFDQVVLSQARARLKLSDAQFFRFGGALRQLQTVRRQQQRQRLTLIRELGQLSASGASDEILAAKTRELDEFASESLRQLKDARDGIDGVLDVRQRAEFRVFEELMERRKLDLLARARRAADSSGGPPPAP